MRSHLSDYLAPLGVERIGTELYDVINVPTHFPTQNKVLLWHPMAKKHNVDMIHELVRLTSNSLSGEFPEDYEWEWLESPLKSKWATWGWFHKRWAKNGLRLKKPPKAGSKTVIELHRLEDGRTHVHVHSIRARLTDEDGVSCKALLDGLVKAGFFPDDKPDYIHGMTQSQEKL